MLEGAHLLDRETILKAFDKLSSELARRQLRADMFVVGGAAIAIAYNNSRRTRDVDAVFSNTAEVYEAARAVARRLKLPNDWLNDAVRSYLLGPDADQVPLRQDGVLQIAVGSASYVLAMKLLAARVEQDQDDIRLLYDRLGLSSWGDGIEIVKRYLPTQEVPQETVDLLVAMFPPGSGSAAEPVMTDSELARCRLCGRQLCSATSIVAGIDPKCALR